MANFIETGKSILKEEALALLSFSESLNKNFSTAIETILNCKGTVLITGMGKSGIIAQKWSSTFSSLGTKSYYINPAEASHGDLGIIHEQDILIALSFSGETEELNFILKFARERNIPIIGITGNLKSSLAEKSLLNILIPIEKEAGVGFAPTTSTTLMLALGDSIAMTLAEHKGFSAVDFAKLHPGGSLGKRYHLKVSELMHSDRAIPLVSASTTLENTLLEMTNKRLGCAIVHENNSLLGIITDGDLRRHFQKNPLTQQTTAKDLMTLNPKTISPKALAFAAKEVMEQNKIQQLIVCDETNKLVGILHIQDLMRANVI
jgi:arabinose-5-phosphate isomerase